MTKIHRIIQNTKMNKKKTKDHTKETHMYVLVCLMSIVV